MQRDNHPGMNGRLQELETLPDSELIEIRSKASRILDERAKARKKEALSDIRRQARELGLKVHFTERKSQRLLRRSAQGPKDESA